MEKKEIAKIIKKYTIGKKETLNYTRQFMNITTEYS